MEDLKFKVLNFLKDKGEFVSGEALASALGVSRTAVWKSIGHLRGLGYVIDASPRRGYCFVSSPDLLIPCEVQRGLKTATFGREIVYHDKVESTNDIAKYLALKGAPEGTIVIAEKQTTGRGRMGRRWFSPEGGLWFSLILRPGLVPGEVPLLALMLGVGVAKALMARGLECTLKWPNDILIKEKKVCGILTEIDAEMDRVNYVIAGIGINVNNEIKDFPSEYKGSSTTVKKEINREISRVKLLRRILEELEEAYFALEKKGGQALLQDWRQLSSTLGRKVKVVTRRRTIEGTALDVAEDGALLIQLGNGRLEKLLSGDCLHLGNI
jgi:BirA family biotin operon repressor/biotin-[acetyl-CoA-carboxylase] ligase